jgi:hypothetical protein
VSWWSANNDLLMKVYSDAYSIFSTTTSSQTRIFYEVRRLAYENEEVKKRGITKEEIDAWEKTHWSKEAPVIIKITT